MAKRARIYTGTEFVDVIGVPGEAGPQGPQGPQGIQGTAGADGADGAPGLIGIDWKGAWSSGDSYVVTDGVSYNGASYIALTNNTNTQPDINLTPSDVTAGTTSGGLAAAADKSATGFYVTAQTTVHKMTVWAFNGTMNSGTTWEIVQGADPNTATIVATGTTPSSATNGTSTTVTFASPVTLNTATQYWVRTPGGTAIHGLTNSASVTGVVTSLTALRYGSTYQSTWSGYYHKFALLTTVSAAWGIVAAKGDTGATGADGALISGWKGPWLAGSTYAAGDVVSSNGSSWLAVEGSTGITPTTAAVTNKTGEVAVTSSNNGSWTITVYQSFSLSRNATVTHMAAQAGGWAVQNSAGTVLATFTGTGTGNAVALSVPVSMTANTTYYLARTSGTVYQWASGNVSRTGIVSTPYGADSARGSNANTNYMPLAVYENQNVWNYIASIGQGIAAGGTAGQILTKASATDYDTAWTGAPLRYKGAWAGTPYSLNDVVTYGDALYRANQDVAAGSVSYVNKGYSYTTSGTVPTGVQAGDLIMVCSICRNDNPASQTLTGYTKIATGNSPNMGGTIFIKTADGTESGTTVSPTPNNWSWPSTYILVFRSAVWNNYAVTAADNVTTQTMPSVTPTLAPGARVRIVLRAINDGITASSTISEGTLISREGSLMATWLSYADTSASGTASFVSNVGTARHTISFTVALQATNTFNSSYWDRMATSVLAGGTTGQILGKDTSTDYDYSWIDPPRSLSPFFLMGG